MRFFWILIFIFNSKVALSQETVTCDGSSGTPVCTSSLGVSLLQPISPGVGSTIPVQINGTAQKIAIPQAGGVSLNLKTLPGSQPSNYWVSIDNTGVVDFTADLSSKVKTASLTETAFNASSIVLTAGMVNSINLNLSGFSGQSALNFSYQCAQDIANGVFGQVALIQFIERRQLDPNAPPKQCDAQDLSFIQSNTHQTFCPPGTIDLNDDNDLNPSFPLTRLAPESKCLLQQDVRQCLIQGSKYKCKIHTSYQEFGVCHEGTLLYSGGFCAKPGVDSYDPLTSVTSDSGHPVHFQSQTWVNTAVQHCHTANVFLGLFGGFGTVSTGCEAYNDIMVHQVYVDVDDSTFFYPNGADQNNAIASLCEGFIDETNDLNYIRNYGLSFKNPGTFQLDAQTPVSVAPNTTDLLCTTYAVQNYNTESLAYTDPNFGRNILGITSEPSLSPQRQYGYFNSVCPAGDSLVSFDQLHFNIDWTETYTCTLNSCPNSSLFYSKTPISADSLSLGRGQVGADRGRADIFTYDITYFNFTAQPGTDGLSGTADITNQPTIKYCTNIQDLNDASDVHDAQALTPSVTVNEIDYSAYNIILPPSIPNKIYDTTSQPYIFKRLDSSVRDWIARLTNN